MRVEEFLRRKAALHGGKPAVVTAGRTLSYAELDGMSDAFAAALAGRGIGRGERVVVFMDNCWEAAVAILGILKAGAVFSPFNHQAKAEKLAYVLGNCGAAALVSLARLAPVAAEAAAACPSVRLHVLAGGVSDLLPGALSFEEAVAGQAHTVPHGGIDVDLAMLIYTSGSTGRPKGVMMTHRNVEAASTSVTACIGNEPADVVASALPISFNYGLYQLLMTLHVGMTLVLERSFAYPGAMFETMRRHRATGLPLVPTMAAMILRMRDLEPGFLPDLRYVTNTAAPLPPEHIAGLRRLLPGVAIHSMYGQTESKRGTWLPPDELDRRPGSVGRAIPNTEAYVVDPSGRRCPPGIEGELVIRGPTVMQGYWDDPVATDRVLRLGENPWERVLHTGDLFRTDDEGFLYFLGRMDDIIKCGGEKVAPKEVEAVLHGCPGVSEAIVVGRPDAMLGHVVHAIVVPADPAPSARDVVRHCAARLEPHMVPRSVEFRAELPKTDTGKVSRRLAVMELEAAE